ncbi:MAG: dihydrolipoamide acetyltransferase family protein [Mycobacteriales bacterium]
MSRVREFRLPDLGEGLTEGEILRWYVAAGDTVRLNQPLVEVETAKAAVEVPSPYAGVVTDLLHAEGETVDVGAVLVRFDTEPEAGPLPTGGAAAAERAEPAIEPGLIGGPAAGGRTSVLVGYGPREVTAKRRARIGRAGPQPAPVVPLAPARVSAAAVGAQAARVNAPGAQADAGALAKPPVRKLARDLGVDLSALTGSGPRGSITRGDVEAAVGVSDTSSERLDAWEGGGEREQRVPIKGVRKHTAAAMVASAFTAPHVTEWVSVDVTPTMGLLDRLRDRPEYAGMKLSPLLVLAKALLLAVRRHPLINSSWDEAAQEIVVKRYVNLGIAAATPRGLVVPNVRDADRLSLPELAGALADLTATARAGRTPPAAMTGGTITITNVGVFGVDGGTPILNPGEAAILCFGAVRPMPWVHDGAIAVRQVSQLALSFDHRIVDGQLGSQFLADIAAVLAEPGLALAWS